MKILYFDFCAILILFILGVSMFRKKLGGKTNSKIFLLYLSLFITTFFDFAAEAYDLWVPEDKVKIELLYILFYGYFLARNMIPLIYQHYICAVTDTDHIVKKKKWLRVLFVLPYVGVCLLLITNLFSKKVFYFDEHMVYTRGPLFFGLYVCASMYLYIGLTYLLVYRKVLTTEKFLALVSMYPCNLAAILIQAFVPDYLVEMFINTISFVLVVIIVQRPEERINPTVGIQSHIAYMSDMKKAYILNKPVQILLVKIINHQALLNILGYDTFDLLMKEIAGKLRSCFGGKGSPPGFYYLENGLFAVISENINSSFFKTPARKISGIITERIRMGELDVVLNGCICVFNCPQDFDEYDKMLSFLKIFYTYLPAKGAVTYLGEMQEKQKTELRMRNEINGIVSKAIAENRFEMYYQPIYSVKEKRFISAEALIRLNDETYGFISPELFIKASEKNGTILQIGEFVLDSVCCFLSECSKDGLPIDYIELNLSMKQCMQNDLTEKVLYYIEKYNLKPEQINLEITETAANTAQDTVEANMCELSKHNIKFSLDDYGTGYSNFSRITELPFQIVKIDKSMADKVFDDKMKTILKYNVCLLKEIGMEIVVEGVETEDMVKQFEEMGCDYIQGYYFSRPLPKHEFVEFIKSHQQ